MQPMMALLPASHTEATYRAFELSSVDYAGPFVTKQGRGRAREKRYLCLFTCLSTRAVHLEMACGLTTDSFLNAFTRMTARRGVPREMLSDNGTNFVGAVRELKALVSSMDFDCIEEVTARRQVRWRFQPPLAPHFSGVHESLVKSAKSAIYQVLNNAEVTDEELQSVFVGVEGLLNSRPITYQSANADDLLPLTPNHFIFGRIETQFAPAAVDKKDYNIKVRWRRVQELIRHIWDRWLKEWLPTLRARSKWRKDSTDVQIDDIVIIVEDDAPRRRWPLGRVVSVFPGADGRVRAIDVKVNGHVLRRPVVRLCPLTD